MSFPGNDKLAFLKNISKEAGKILMKFFRGNFEIENKEGSELLTTADKKSEELIISEMRKKYPEIAIIAEETKPGNWQEKEAFIIDPLDGTNNFSSGIPIFTISLAYQLDGDLKIGVVYDPVHEELFYAEKGKKAFLNDSIISVSKRRKLSDSILATGFPYIKKTEKDSNVPEFSALLMKSRGLRRLGSAALDLCYVACGRLDGYWEKSLKIWDVAAGGLIVSEAGGKITNFLGDDWNHLSDKVIASNGLIHSEIQEVINKL
jgi:myo-inositol-1(or 4)-monophosphatase